MCQQCDRCFRTCAHRWTTYCPATDRPEHIHPHMSDLELHICDDAEMIFKSADISSAAFEAATGWEIKPEGACKRDVCVPLSDNRDIPSIAQRLGMAVVTDDTTGQVAIGPASLGGKALDTAVMPDVVLHDLDGNEVNLSRFHGEKMVLVGWAPY